jgi:DNA-binding NarL/FixJ family response regulator
VIGTIAAEMAMAGEPAERTAELAAEVLARFDPSGVSAQDWSGWNAVRTLVLCGRYGTALAILNRAQDTAGERGAVLEMGSVFVFRAELYLHTGDIVGAELDARALGEIASSYGWPIGEDFALAWLGDALVQRGELAEAERLLTAGVFAGSPGAVPAAYMRADVLLARGGLRVAQGRPADAVEDIRECGRRQTELGSLSPVMCAWRSHLAHALMDLGESAEAEELASEELGLARRVGVPRALAVALRSMARARGGTEAIALLQEAADVVERSGAQLERARVQAALGSALHRSGRPEEAREALRLAVDLAHRCGAKAIENRALAELRATGARPRRSLTTGAGSLTPSELRIAELAAAGQLNREIAEALFVTTNTVEYHLRNAYRKLGIGGRTQLAEALSRDALA